MKSKNILICCLPLLAVVAVYANLPGKNPVSEYSLRPEETSAERSEELKLLVEAIKSKCDQKNYSWIESCAFGIPHGMRMQEKAATGIDTVGESLDILKKNAETLDWNQLKFTTYSNALNSYDVTMASHDGTKNIVLRFQRQPKQGNYNLSFISEQPAE